MTIKAGNDCIIEAGNECIEAGNDCVEAAQTFLYVKIAKLENADFYFS